MILEKILTKEQLKELFEEQKAVFSDTVSQIGDDGKSTKYRPRADFYTTGTKVATVTYPSFKDASDMATRFDQAAWFPKLIHADESILYLDVTTEVVNTKTGIPIDSDVFLCLKTSTHNLEWEASPYYMNPDVEYPVWNLDFEVTEENIFSLHDIIASLNFAITNGRHNLDIHVVMNYMQANGFEIDFHHPFVADTFRVIENATFF